MTYLKSMGLKTRRTMVFVLHFILNLDEGLEVMFCLKNHEVDQQNH